MSLDLTDSRDSIDSVSLGSTAPTLGLQAIRDLKPPPTPDVSSELSKLALDCKERVVVQGEVVMKTDVKAGFYGVRRIQLADSFHGYCRAATMAAAPLVSLEVFSQMVRLLRNVGSRLQTSKMKTDKKNRGLYNMMLFTLRPEEFIFLIE